MKGEEGDKKDEKKRLITTETVETGRVCNVSSHVPVSCGQMTFMCSSVAFLISHCMVFTCSDVIWSSSDLSSHVFKFHILLVCVQLSLCFSDLSSHVFRC